MKPSSAYLLVSHGSRDPRPQIAIDHLAKLVAQRLSRVSTSLAVSTAAQGTWISSLAQSTSPISVGTAVLELAPLPLHQQIQNFARMIAAQGYTHLEIVPLFLLPGVHVMEDIPQEVNLSQSALPTDMTLEIRPYLGSHPHLKHLLVNPLYPITASPTAGKILLAHGSRRPNGNQPVETIATQLNAIPAYWSVSPSLETQLSRLIKQGYQQIAILPYFLFEGGITDAIIQEVHRFSQQYPYVQLQLGKPIGATPALADLLVEIIGAE